jgi:hypothetical protein
MEDRGVVEAVQPGYLIDFARLERNFWRLS